MAESPELFAVLQIAAASAASESRRSMKHKTGSEGNGTVSAVDCECADNKHHAHAKSLSMFETTTQKTDRRRPTPFPNTNEVECMPATSLHDLLCTTVQSMHTHSARCKSRPAGLVTSFTRSFGLAHLDLYCWRCRGGLLVCGATSTQEMGYRLLSQG